MSLLSHYRTLCTGRRVPPELALPMVRAMKGQTIEEMHETISSFAGEVIFQYPIEDADTLALIIDPDFLPEDDPLIKALRERRIPLHSRLAFMDYTNLHIGQESDPLRERLAREIEAAYPLRKTYRKLYKRQQGKSEAEKQRLGLKFHLEQDLALATAAELPEDMPRATA